MRVYNLGEDELSQYDLERVEAAGATTVWYQYEDGGYDGTGNMLFYGDAGWGIVNLGHCSCNSPTDDIDDVRYDSLDEVLKHCSDGYRFEWSTLLDAARAVEGRIIASRDVVRTRRILLD